MASIGVCVACQGTANQPKRVMFMFPSQIEVVVSFCYLYFDPTPACYINTSVGIPVGDLINYSTKHMSLGSRVGSSTQQHRTEPILSRL